MMTAQPPHAREHVAAAYAATGLDPARVYLVLAVLDATPDRDQRIELLVDRLNLKRGPAAKLIDVAVEAIEGITE